MIALINYFGQNDGFDFLSIYFSDNQLSSTLIFIYLTPFENCLEFLSKQILESYFIPIIQLVANFFNNLSVENFKNELKSSTQIDDIIGSIVKKCRNFAIKLSRPAMAKSFEFLRLKFTLRTLQLSSFSGKMNALNELNKIISHYNYCEEKTTNNYTLINQTNDSSSIELLATSDETAQWLYDNNVVEIILNDCLHHTQYVEKLDNIFRFLLKENRLTLDCLDRIWNSQLGKHEIIVKNIHELIAKLAWHFSPNQLDHLFVCFQSSWSTATKKEREKLLQLMRRLAEDDKYGSMANKMLSLLWNIAYNHDEIDIEIVDQAIGAHLKILDYSKTFEKDSQRFYWIERCVNEIGDSNHGNNVITAMKHIREILLLCPEHCSKQYYASCEIQQQQQQRIKRETRHYIITKMNSELELMSMLVRNLSNYMKWMRSKKSELNELDANIALDGRRISHRQELHERLGFLRFIIQEGTCLLSKEMATELWNCLAIQAIFPTDRQICFQWFSLLMEFDFYLDDDYSHVFLGFLHASLAKFDPSLIDIYGVECFEKFFKIINCNQEKLIYHNSSYLTNDVDLIGLDYLWKLILFGSNEAACNKAINLLKEFFTNFGPKLIESRLELHQDFINICFDQLKCSYDTVTVIGHDENEPKINVESTKMIRLLSVLCEYIRKGDNDYYGNKRLILPMSQCFRGKSVELVIKIMTQAYNRNIDELILQTHTNESILFVREKILEK